MSEVKILKKKLELYGEYSRMITEKEKQLDRIVMASINHSGNDHKAAKELGYSSDDPKKPIENMMIIDLISFEKDIQDLEMERDYLGINEFISDLSDEDYEIIKMAFIEDCSHEDIGFQLGYSKQWVQKKISAILERVVATT